MSSPTAAVAPAPSSPLQEAIARDAVVAWFRGEFAAANAIIDSLCHHLTQIGGADHAAEYKPVFAAIHRRRLNWIPVLQMQKYFSIAEIAIELRNLAAKKKEKAMEKGRDEEVAVDKARINAIRLEKSSPGEEVKTDGGVDDDLDGGDSSDQKTESGEGSQVENSSSESFQIFSDHEDSNERPARIKITKGFVAKEPVKGHMTNVVKGLKLYDDIFTELELSKLTHFINELRVAGRNGELSGDTFILFNTQVKGIKREIIQLGTPIFGSAKDDGAYNIEPIPAPLQSVIDHLVQCRLLPEKRKPNGCIINFFDEGEFSQPYMKPPHLDQPVSTLVLSESTIAFGRVLFGDGQGNFKGPLMLSLGEGSLVVMRGNSAEMARHVMCASASKRVSLTFFKVREPGPADPAKAASPVPPLTPAMTLWQPGRPQPYELQAGPIAYAPAAAVVPKWGLLRPAPPLVMLPAAPAPAKRMSRGGTGVFLPWTTGGPRKSSRHLPPRIQRGRLMPHSSGEASVAGISVAG